MSAHPAPRATRLIRAETAGSSGVALGPNQRGKAGGEVEASIPVMAMAHQAHPTEGSAGEPILPDAGRSCHRSAEASPPSRRSGAPIYAGSARDTAEVRLIFRFGLTYLKRDGRDPLLLTISDGVQRSANRCPGGDTAPSASFVRVAVGATPSRKRRSGWRRVTSQERYLQDARFEWRSRSFEKPDWDHDHCDVGWVHFGDHIFSDDADTQLEGWATADGDHWVCRTCFADFRES
jgi:hypothetical protein